MDAATLEKMDVRRETIYPRRFTAVYRERGYYVIHNLLNGARRFYADARDVAARLDCPDFDRARS